MQPNVESRQRLFNLLYNDTREKDLFMDKGIQKNFLPVQWIVQGGFSVSSFTNDWCGKCYGLMDLNIYVDRLNDITIIIGNSAPWLKLQWDSWWLWCEM